eukprot:546696-Prymnesium_polylepis.1
MRPHPITARCEPVLGLYLRLFLPPRSPLLLESERVPRGAPPPALRRLAAAPASLSAPRPLLPSAAALALREALLCAWTSRPSRKAWSVIPRGQ